MHRTALKKPIKPHVFATTMGAKLLFKPLISNTNTGGKVGKQHDAGSSSPSLSTPIGAKLALGFPELDTPF